MSGNRLSIARSAEVDRRAQAFQITDTQRRKILQPHSSGDTLYANYAHQWLGWGQYEGSTNLEAAITE